MSELDQQRPRSPLESERGSTSIAEGVVSKIAGLAAREVEGIYMGGSASRAARGLLGSVPGSQDLSRGISVEVGRIETAIDVTMGIEYGRNILQLAERVRDEITERVENLTGLRVTELNVTISDVVFPGQEGGGEGRRRGVLRSRSGDEDRTQAPRTEEIRAGSREREAADTEPVDLGAARGSDNPGWT
jgi:uncharacterized alkaline shock family protein YloU